MANLGCWLKGDGVRRGFIGPTIRYGLFSEAKMCLKTIKKKVPKPYKKDPSLEVGCVIVMEDSKPKSVMFVL